IKRKRLADVVESLIGATFFSNNFKEEKPLQLLHQLYEVDLETFFLNSKLTILNHFSKREEDSLSLIESSLKYSFRKPELLEEALTHGSYMGEKSHLGQ